MSGALRPVVPGIRATRAERLNTVFSSSHKRYVLGVITAVYTVSLLDRGLIMLLLQPIKQDLHLTDTQLGFLTGLAFGVFYATLGVPIARWADRSDRVTISSLSIGLWGLTCMACLFVGNYTQLVFARIAAAVGEAGCKPPTYSLVGDYFPDAAARPRAMAVYLTGGSLASLLSFALGGWVSERLGWRSAFVLAGVCGPVLALLTRLTIRDPRSTKRSGSGEFPTLRDVFRDLWRQRSFRHLSAALILISSMGLGLGPWYAAFMIRTHGMGTSELGVWLGLTFSIGGVAGVLLGGHVASRSLAASERGQLRLGALAIASTVPLYVVFLTVQQRYIALGSLLPLMVVLFVCLGPVYALMQRLVRDEMRATGLAIVLLLANLIGMGVGPQAVGILSDLLAPTLGRDSLRIAMLAMSMVSIWAGYHLWRAGRTVEADLAERSHLHSKASEGNLHGRLAVEHRTKPCQ
jgi:predicted MFS family arabinose efflux permease